MRKLLLVLLLLTAASVGYCSLPLTSVAVLTVQVTDRQGNRIMADTAATYLDAAGQTIATITPETPGSWDNNLHWWMHSHHRTSTRRPADAERAVAVEVTARGCSTVRLPVALERTYEPLSFSPHGGGPAYFIYRYDGKAVLDCG